MPALVFAVCLMVACGDDDGVMDRPDYTKVSYKLELGTGWLQLYDVTVEYYTADGQPKSFTMKEDKWEFEDKVDGQYKKFFYRVTAKAKHTTLDPTDPEIAALLAKDKDLTYTYEYHYYEKETSAHVIKPEMQGKVVGAGDIASYVEAHPTVKLLEHSVQVN